MPTMPCRPSIMSVESVSQTSKEVKDLESVAVRDGVIAEDVYRPDVDTSGIDERKLMRRIDWHVVPWLAVLYLLNFLDRGSIGNAKVSNTPMTSALSHNHRL